MTTKKSVKKMYCEMFQSVMKAGISTIPWRTPKLMKGAGAGPPPSCGDQTERVKKGAYRYRSYSDRARAS